MARKERPVAVLAPSHRSIKLYADGRIEYHGKSGSVIGATARLEKSGEQHGLRDTRKVVLRIDGPSVGIAAPLPAAAFRLHKYAEEFAAQVNEMSNGVNGSAPAPGLPSRPDPQKTIHQPSTTDPPMSMDGLIGQLERIGRLRDDGVLTEDEFQELKAALLRAAPNS